MRPHESTSRPVAPIPWRAQSEIHVVYLFGDKGDTNNVDHHTIHENSCRRRVAHHRRSHVDSNRFSGISSRSHSSFPAGRDRPHRPANAGEPAGHTFWSHWSNTTQLLARRRIFCAPHGSIPSWCQQLPLPTESRPESGSSHPGNRNECLLLVVNDVGGADPTRILHLHLQSQRGATQQLHLPHRRHERVGQGTWSFHRHGVDPHPHRQG